MKKITRFVTIIALLVMLNSVMAFAVTKTCTSPSAGKTTTFSTAPTAAVVAESAATVTTPGGAPTSAAQTIGGTYCLDGACLGVSANTQQCFNGADTAVSTTLTNTGIGQTLETATSTSTASVSDLAGFNYNAYYLSDGDFIIEKIAANTGDDSWSNTYTPSACTTGVTNVKLAYDTTGGSLLGAVNCLVGGLDAIVVFDLSAADGSIVNAAGYNVGTALTSIRMGATNPTTPQKQAMTPFAWTSTTATDFYLVGTGTNGPDTFGLVIKFNDDMTVDTAINLDVAGNDPVTLNSIALNTNGEANVISTTIATTGSYDPTGATNKRGVIMKVNTGTLTTTNIQNYAISGADVTFSNVAADSGASTIASSGTSTSDCLAVAVSQAALTVGGAFTYTGCTNSVGIFSEEDNTDFAFVFSGSSGNAIIGQTNTDATSVDAINVANFIPRAAQPNNPRDALLASGDFMAYGALALINLGGATPNILDLVLIDLTTSSSESYGAMSPPLTNVYMTAGTSSAETMAYSYTEGYTGTTPEFSLSTLLLTILVAGGIMMFVVRRRYN